MPNHNCNECKDLTEEHGSFFCKYHEEMEAICTKEREEMNEFMFV